MYFCSCFPETRCKYFIEIIDLFKKLISPLDIPDFISLCSISAIAALSSGFKIFKSSNVLKL